MTTAARTALVSLLALAITVGAGPGQAASFTVDVSRSSLVVQLFRDGVAARLAHDHVVQARAFTGTMVYDPRNPDASSIQVTVEVGSLQADDPATRRKFGLTGGISARDRADIGKALKME